MPADSVTVVSVHAPGGKPDLRVVRLSEGTSLRLPVDLVRAEGLTVGSHIDSDRFDALARHDRLVRTRARARRLLAVRPRTEEELRRALLRGDVAPPVVETVVEQLVRDGALDDEAWARSFAEERRRLKRHAPARIEADLRRRGIAPELAHATAYEAYKNEIEAGNVLFDEALDLLRRRSGRYEGLRAEVAGRRLAGLLNRAGYPVATVIDAVRVVVEEMTAAGLLVDE